MPTICSTQLPPPKAWDEFETLCADLASVAWKYTNVAVYGRRGQAQQGVDIYGVSTQRGLIGIQCKGKRNWPQEKLSKREVWTSIAAAKKFRPKLKQLIIATSAPNDAVIQELVRVCSDKNRARGQFSVSVLSWDEIQRDLTNHPSLVKKHYPQFFSQSSRVQKNGLGIKVEHPFRVEANFQRRPIEELRLNDWWNSPSQPVFVLHGIGGIGKSSLCWNWVSRETQTTKPKQGRESRNLRSKSPHHFGVFWWSFYEFGADFDRFLEKALLYLNSADKNRPHSQTLDRVGLLVSLLQETRVLIVLDGFEILLRGFSSNKNGSANGQGKYVIRSCIDPRVARFLERLAGAGHSPGAAKILINSRTVPRELEGKDGLPLAGCLIHRLKELSLPDSVAFLRAQGVLGTKPELEEVARPYGGHPLTLRVLSGIILHDPITPADVRVAKGLNIGGSIKRRRHHVFEAACGGLSRNSTHLLNLICCCRFVIEYDALEQILGTKFSIRSVLVDLIDRGLLQQEATARRYSVHAILRDYVYAAIKNGRELHLRLAKYYQELPPPAAVLSLDDILSGVERMFHLLRAKRLDEAWLYYYQKLEKYLYYQFGAYQTALELLLHFYPMGESDMPALQKDQDKLDCLSALGVLRTRLGQSSNAKELTAKALMIAEKTNNLTDIGICSGNLAADEVLLGQLHAAEKHLVRRMQVSQSNPKGLNTARQEYSRLLTLLGRVDDARHELNLAKRHWRKEDNTHGLAIVAAYDALAQLRAKRFGAALRAARKSATLSQLERNRVQATWLEAEATISLAESTTRNRVVRLKNAERCLISSLGLCREIDLIEFEACILLTWARWHRIAGQVSTAQRTALDAYAIASRCGYILQEAEIEVFLARIAAEQGHREEGRRRLSRAIALATQNDTRYSYVYVIEQATTLSAELSPFARGR